MKKFISVALVLGLSASLAACTSTGSDAGAGGRDVVVVQGFGAEYATLFTENIAKPFTKKTGIQVKYRAGGAGAETYAAIRAANGEPGFDLAVMTYFELDQGHQDHLLAPVTQKQVPNMAHVPQKLREHTYGVGAIQDVQQVSLMYNRDDFPKPPTSWDVMWDPKYGKGTLVFNPNNILGVYALLNLADIGGGSITNTSPAFKRTEEMAKHALATPTTSAEAVPFMAKQTATAFPYFDGRAAIYAKTNNYDFTVPREGTYAHLGGLGIPEGAQHKDNAYKLIDYWLSKEVQERWARAYNVGPAISGLTFPADFAAKHITTPEKLAKVKIADAATVNKHRTQWQQEWQEAVR
ncbi:PotD/PotF family extracellular solute-binding protein [Streptomyces sp. CoT10]|uniref:ABC transporter substrate-binding protein n=1 Tax=Streptomyces sp. CoT10 TaxID=2875762 RepID=UPI001CD5CC5F|nr:extracellular solute-binding protein [Streptomyces sp. CoT10]